MIVRERRSRRRPDALDIYADEEFIGTVYPRRARPRYYDMEYVAVPPSGARIDQAKPTVAEAIHLLLDAQS